jgi:prepilin-type N-terminal cleavage/methylation domain-containing protein
MTRSRDGFTIIEMLIAIMIFSVGVLALAGTASVIVSNLTGTQSRTIATSVAESRFERLGAVSCTGRPLSGSAVTRGISETWTIDRLVRADDVTVAVTYLGRNHRQSTEQFRTFLPC